MDRLHARYPFLESAREAVEAADVDLAELVAEEPAVVQRGRQRVESALSRGTVEPEGRQPARVELLSYPVARVLVSLLDEPRAVDTYARAEAATARERIEVDLDSDGDLRSTRDRRLDLNRLLAEFDLRGEIEAGDRPRVRLPTYLQLSGNLDGERWRLVDRRVDAGWVPVEREELYDLFEEAIGERVAAGLPLDVPDAIAEALEDQREAVAELFTDRELPAAFDVVDPDGFPPCIEALLERAAAGESLPEHSQFAVVAFLSRMGLGADAVSELTGDGLDRETVEYQLAHVQGERGPEYAPPSCAAMEAYGDCVNRDERCDRVNHPVTYYERALEEREEATPG